ncbi:MATE efflux family protein [Actinidia rufa]|uniref:MATE efflux family protein n=1 Tax=Actinidia rufa TaxID=165716 RepID=A0A7J0H2R7_9ERIC|nr:MATE efflux family protein [Actinidia rufa]
MASALETFFGQAYGAKQYHMLGMHLQRAMLVLMLTSVPIAIIWNFTGHLFALCGQDSEISTLAGVYARWLIPSIFPYGLLQCQIRFLQAQNNVKPLILSTIVSFHSLAIPSALMICLEYWSYEFLILMSGLLPSSKLETSMMAISTRVSNELGAGQPRVARLAVKIALFLAIAQGVLLSLILVSVRNKWGYLYTSEDKVVKYMASVMPVLVISNFMDGIQAVLSGTARGCGWQKIGAFVNLGAYYLIGLPSAIILTFLLHFGGKDSGGDGESGDGDPKYSTSPKGEEEAALTWTN